MRLQRLWHSRIGKGFSRAGRTVQSSGLGRKYYAKRLLKKSSVPEAREELEGVFHDLKAPFRISHSFLGFLIEDAKTPAVREKIKKMYSESSGLHSEFSTIYSKFVAGLLKPLEELDREMESLSEKRTLSGHRRKMEAEMSRVFGEIDSRKKAIIGKTQNLVRDADSLLKTGLPGEEAELREYLEKAKRNLLLGLEAFESFSPRELSRKSRIEIISLSNSVGGTVNRILNNRPKRERIAVSTVIHANWNIKIDRRDFASAVENIVDNSLRHSPGCSLEIRAFEQKEHHGQGYYVVEFLSVKGNPFREETIHVSGKAEPASLATEGTGLRRVKNLLIKYGGDLELENTARGPKAKMVFHIS